MTLYSSDTRVDSRDLEFTRNSRPPVRIDGRYCLLTSFGNSEADSYPT